MICFTKIRVGRKRIPMEKKYKQQKRQHQDQGEWTNTFYEGGETGIRDDLTQKGGEGVVFLFLKQTG